MPRPLSAFLSSWRDRRRRLAHGREALGVDQRLLGRDQLASFAARPCSSSRRLAQLAIALANGPFHAQEIVDQDAEFVASRRVLDRQREAARP